METRKIPNGFVTKDGRTFIFRTPTGEDLDARKAGLKVLVLRMIANNDQSRHVYQKAGFKGTGIIPRGIYRKNKYIDDVITTVIL